jgi:hypothetical protein
MTRRAWTTEEDDDLRRRYPTELAKDLAVALGRTLSSIHARAEKLDLQKDLAFVAEVARRNTSTPGHGSERTRFQPGQRSHNYGTTGVCGVHPSSQAHWFRPGQINGRAGAQIKPIGSYRVTTEGYLEQKLSDESGPSNRRWRAVHRMVWEAAHGPIPPGHVVVFKDGKARTELAEITPDVLELVSRGELMRRNSYHTTYPKEMRDIVRLRAVLSRQINRKAGTT